MEEKEKEIPEEEKIELCSEELQEVLGHVPHWILRRGITLLGVIAVLLLVGSAVFKYPDIISARATLTGAAPPAAIVAKAGGRLDTIYVHDKQEVSAGQYLAAIDNPASTGDVMRIKEYLSVFELSDTQRILPPKDMSLGALQGIYLGFYSTLLEYNDFVELSYHPSKTAFINGRLRGYEVQYRDMERQNALVREQLGIAENQFGRDSVLMQKGVLSAGEFEDSRTRLIQVRLTYENSVVSLGNMKLQIAQTRESLFENSHQYTERINTLRSQLMSLSTQLASDIHTWEMTYMLQSPVGGRVTFTRYWVRNQNVTAGEEVFVIVPADSASLVVKAQIPAAGSGKVREGQRVNIRFDNFPENEFGLVEGVVKSVSLVPVVNSDNSVIYTADIGLSGGLVTSYKKELPYLPGMTGTADIVTDDLSLLVRFFMPLRKLWTQSVRQG